MRSRLLLFLALLPLALPARGEDSNIKFNTPALLGKKDPTRAPDVKAAPQAWPRLDPGSALCRSEDDLTRLAANRARTEGGGPADCRIMQVPTAVQIVTRAGTGRTQVRLTDQPAVVGWTDVWLPEKAPGQR
jgi:hypothetical protein